MLRMTSEARGNRALDDVLERIVGNSADSPDVMRIAVRCGLRLLPNEDGTSGLRGRAVLFDACAPVEEQERQVAAVVATNVLERCDLEPTPDAVEYVASALVKRG